MNQQHLPKFFYFFTKVLGLEIAKQRGEQSPDHWITKIPLRSAKKGIFVLDGIDQPEGSGKDPVHKKSSSEITIDELKGKKKHLNAHNS